MADLPLKERITADMKEAMKAKDTEKLGVIRMIMAAIKQQEIDKQITLDEAQTLAVIEKMIKQRNDAIKQFAEAGRDDLVAKESAEADVLKIYLPPQLSDEEIEAAIKAAITETGASSMADMGKVMGVLKPQLTGKADMGNVSGKIKALLS